VNRGPGPDRGLRPTTSRACRHRGQDAAQLICEYGDLETLLARAGEIKQEKRRQTLLDNADKARLPSSSSPGPERRPRRAGGDLAVHDPDYKKLVAFLKAMEFNTLTRRVAEFSGIDAGEIEPDAKLRVGVPSSPAVDGEGERSSPGGGKSRKRRPTPALRRKRGRGASAGQGATPKSLPTRA